MIRTESEYQEVLRRIEQDRQVEQQQQQTLVGLGLREEEIARAMEPIRTFNAQLVEEVEWYERIRRGDLPALLNFTNLGRFLITLRIAQGLTQRQLAERLGVPESQVSRDERYEYHGIGVDRVQRILDALGVTLRTEVDRGAAAGSREPIPA